MANTYNGYKNYPTWNVALWISNDEGTYRLWNERAAELAAGDGMGNFPPRKLRGLLADELKESLRSFGPESMPDENQGMLSDLLGYALDCVDWHEVADSILDE